MRLSLNSSRSSSFPVWLPVMVSFSSPVDAAGKVCSWEGVQWCLLGCVLLGETPEISVREPPASVLGFLSEKVISDFQFKARNRYKYKMVVFFS